MSDFRLRSKEYLANELKDCFHDMYVSALDRAEKHLRPDKKSKEWEFFRFEILNMGNEYIRRVDNILSEYLVEFRPIVFSVEYKGTPNVSNSRLASFEFGFKDDQVPFLRIWMPGSEESNNCLLDIQELLDCGRVLNTTEGALVYLVEGMYDVFFKVIPFFTTTNSLKGKALERFNAWKEKVYELEGKGTKNVK